MKRRPKLDKKGHIVESEASIQKLRLLRRIAGRFLDAKAKGG